MADLAAYTTRINATNFALANDDGTGGDYAHADVVLVGVSRSGKTPTCLYMALQYGVFAANYPLTEEDLEAGKLPPRLAPYRRKLYALTIKPERLQQIRNERRPESRYASRQQVQYELRAAEALFARYRNPLARYHRMLHRGDRQPHSQHQRASSGACAPEAARFELAIVARARVARERVCRSHENCKRRAARGANSRFDRLAARGLCVIVSSVLLADTHTSFPGARARAASSRSWACTRATTSASAGSPGTCARSPDATLPRCAGTVISFSP